MGDDQGTLALGRSLEKMACVGRRGKQRQSRKGCPEEQGSKSLGDHGRTRATRLSHDCEPQGLVFSWHRDIVTQRGRHMDPT